MKKIKYILSSAILTLFLFGCDVQEAKQDPAELGSTDGYSTALFTFAGGDLTSNEQDGTVYVYDVELSKPLKYNIDFSFVQTGGTAAEGEDFTFVRATVPAFETSGQMSVVINNDVAVEDSETLELTIVPGPSVADSWLLKPGGTQYPELSITIDNFTSGDLDIGMEWAADNGSGDSATALADLILLITDAVSPYTTIIGGADGGSFETWTMSEDTPDGDYFVVADVYAIDDSDFDMDINVTFDQGGVIQGASIDTPMAMNSGILCNEYVVLAKITKSGTTYSWVTENGALTNNGSPDASLAAPYIGTAAVVVDDWADYGVGDPIVIEAGAADNEFWIRSYANPYISNPDTSYMIVTINDVCGNVTVQSNEDFDYGCDNGNVIGTGTVDPTTMTVDVTLNFQLGGCGDYPGNQFVLQL